MKHANNAPGTPPPRPTVDECIQARDEVIRRLQRERDELKRQVRVLRQAAEDAVDILEVPGYAALVALSGKSRFVSPVSRIERLTR